MRGNEAAGSATTAPLSTTSAIRRADVAIESWQLQLRKIPDRPPSGSARRCGYPDRSADHRGMRRNGDHSAIPRRRGQCFANTPDRNRTASSSTRSQGRPSSFQPATDGPVCGGAPGDTCQSRVTRIASTRNAGDPARTGRRYDRARCVAPAPRQSARRSRGMPRATRGRPPRRRSSPAEARPRWR